jgi:hypothetical protein
MTGTSDWIAAAEALSIASDRLGADAAPGALIAGAETGTIKARAQRFDVETPNACGQKMTFEDELVELPREFWSSDGRAMVEQDWAAGRFASLVNDNFRHQALGVEFDRGAIEALAQRAN